MENSNSNHYKHLTLQDRYDIEEGLNRNHSISRIADMLRRDRTTISKEISKRRVGNSLRNSPSNDCLHKVQCPRLHLCTDCPLDRRCSTCRKIDCRSICPDYFSDSCRYTRKSPFVCNGCSMVYDCSKPHFYYRANSAHTAYLDALSNSREGIGLSRQELYDLDCLITPLIKQGQSISHIYCIHKNEIPCSMKTLYNYINQNILTIRNIDLPKKVKYKIRKKKRSNPAITFAYRENRTYIDLQNYISQHPYDNVVELDTVHGSNKKGKVLLTMLFRNCNFMLIFLLEECTQLCVQKVFDSLEEGLGSELFRRLFGVILTDNGSEFKNPTALETSLEDGLRTKIYFCDPLASWQKGKLEKNHEYIRKVIPKGIPLKDYTPQDITLMANHINSTARASLNGRTPLELAQLLLDSKLLELLQLHVIESDKIILTPKLLKH